MTHETLGALLAFGTACCWCLSSVAFEGASRRVGSVPVNLWRTIAAFLLLSIAGAISRGRWLPSDATAHQWKWLLLSGFVGFFIGDVTQFRALVLIGARLTTLVACTAPIFTLAAELLTMPKIQAHPQHALGVLLTIAGVAWVVLERQGGVTRASAGSPSPSPCLPGDSATHGEAGEESAAPRFGVSGIPSVKLHGVVLAVIGAAGQGVGAVLTARAFAPGNYDALAANQIRMIAGVASFACFVLVTRRVRDALAALRNPPALGLLSLGAFWGPFLGVSLFIESLKHVRPSTTQTITCLVPVLIIPLSMRKERISARAIVGACVAVAGVWLVIHASRPA